VRKFLAALIIAAAFSCTLAKGAGILLPVAAPATCSQASTFIAANSLTGSDATNYKNFICSLVSNGMWAKLDALYLLAAPNATVANNNLVSTSYTLTPTNSPTFTAYSGYAGNGTSSYLNSNYNPFLNAVNWAQNSASLFAWSGSNTRADSAAIVGFYASTYFAFINPWNNSINSVAHGLNGGTSFNTFAPGAANGLFVLSRSSSASYSVYRNTAVLGVQASTSISNGSGAVWICALNGNGFGGSNFSTRTVTMAGWGGALTSADITSLYAAGSAYLTAVGAPQ
jgi:hypothetical protein